MSSTFDTIVIIVGLTVVTLVTRNLFLFPRRDVPLPDWLRRGMRYTPLAALMASIVPQVLLTNGELPHTWQDARLWATAVATVAFFWRRSILGTIVAGAVVLVSLRAGLGW